MHGNNDQTDMAGPKTTQHTRHTSHTHTHKRKQHDHETSISYQITALQVGTLLCSALTTGNKKAPKPVGTSTTPNKKIRKIQWLSRLHIYFWKKKLCVRHKSVPKRCTYAMQSLRGILGIDMILEQIQRFLLPSEGKKRSVANINEKEKPSPNIR